VAPLVNLEKEGKGGRLRCFLSNEGRRKGTRDPTYFGEAPSLSLKEGKEKKRRSRLELISPFFFPTRKKKGIDF